MNQEEANKDELYLVRETLVYRNVCAPKSWSAERVQKETNEKFGRPGTHRNEWVIVTDLPEEWLKTDANNPGKCEFQNRVHWLLSC